MMMRTIGKVLLLTVTVAFVAGAGLADSTLEQFDKIKGRSYHASFYDGESCDVCHENNRATSLPADDACQSCHDLDSLVEATARPAGEEGQNPHDNLHYGRDVPCMECHGEHQAREHMCADCHSFEYPNFKE